MRKRLAALWLSLGFDFEECVLCAALVALTIGLWPVMGRAALIAPAAVALWIVLPSRDPFIARPPEKRSQS